jgi:SNF2 family DNA or RNA helicase
VYQVKKEECLDLPPKTYSTSSFGMTKEQRGFYEAFYYELLLSKESFEFGDATIYRLLSGLQRITTGICPSEDGDINIFETSTDNPRIKCLQGIISNIDTRRKVIIWCKYLSEIEDIQSLNLDASLFNGRLSQRERELSLLRFRESKRFFISTLACGGLGLTLNEADYVIFYNQSFKLSERIQSEDRAHRIGQDKSVHYITIYCAASVDEMIMNNIGRKERVVNQFRKEIETIKQFKSKKDAEKAIRELAQKY